MGLSYRSAIFYTSDEQKRVAEDTIADVEASGLWPGKVVTEVSPVGPFWEAEPQHQDYLEKIQTATPAISSDLIGSCQSGKMQMDWRRAPQSSAALAVDRRRSRPRRMRTRRKSNPRKPKLSPRQRSTIRTLLFVDFDLQFGKLLA